MENATLIKELAPFKISISKAEVAANALIIKTTEDMVSATDLLGKIKTVGKAITQKKEGITKPLNEALKSVRAFFSPIELQWANAERTVKTKMIEFQTASIALAAKKTEVIEKKVEEGKMTFEKAADKIEAITPVSTVEATSGAAQFRTIKEVVIEDETLIPREYLMLDMVKIRKVALAGVEIAGVKVIEKQSLAGIKR